MESLRELYRIGYGPSSSHTMGPRAAAERYIREHSDIKSVRVELYGSLAATGKGHLTDKAIVDVFNANGIKNENVLIYIKINSRKVPYNKVFVISFHKNNPKSKK